MSLDEKFDSDASELENVDLKAQRGDDPVHASVQEEQKLIRKIDYRLLPFVFCLYSLSVLDRSNLGNAKLAGMKKDIDLSGNKYNWLGTIFYLGYSTFQWTTIGWKHLRAHRWATFCVFYWGLIATLQSTTSSWGGMMACRFLLGTAEAMFGGGVPLYLSYFYPRQQVGFRTGVFITGAAAANAYGGALAYGITQIRGSVAPWRLLFIIEGAPTCLLAISAWFFLPDSIADASFLSSREKDVAKRMVARSQTVDEGEQKQGVRSSEFWAGIKDPKSYIPGMLYFSTNVSFASLPLFVPTIIAEMGTFSTIQSQGLSSPPYVLCFFVILLNAILSDRFQMRGPFIAGPALLAFIGFVLLATTESTATRYLGVFLAVLIFVSVSIILCWVANIHSNESKRTGGYVVMSLIGQCGPLLGTNVFPDNEAPYYRKGMWISAAFCMLVAVLSTILSLWLIKENRDMEKAGVLDEYDEGETNDKAGAAPSTSRQHRYIW